MRRVSFSAQYFSKSYSISLCKRSTALHTSVAPVTLTPAHCDSFFLFFSPQFLALRRSFGYFNWLKLCTVGAPPRQLNKRSQSQVLTCGPPSQYALQWNFYISLGIHLISGCWLKCLQNLQVDKSHANKLRQSEYSWNIILLGKKKKIWALFFFLHDAHIHKTSMDYIVGDVFRCCFGEGNEHLWTVTLHPTKLHWCKIY